MTMTYKPSWEQETNRWDTEPDFWEVAELEEVENEKVKDELSLEDLILEEIELEEDFDL